ncbi:hypothetical protein Tco_0947097 [Tanacetum coccineum]
MAQPERQADVHQDELCPPNKRYALMDANKKIDLDNPLCPNKSKIMTLKEEGSKYRLTFVLDRKELTMTLDDFRMIFQLPKATDNNHERFVAAPNIFNSGKNKAGVGMKIPSWMITDEMKLTENYQMYAEAFGVDVPTTQSQTIESTQGTHRTTSTPKILNPDVNEGESTEEIEKMVEGTKNVDAHEFVNYILNNQNDPGTRLDPESHKESPEVEIINDVQPVNVTKEEDESAEDDYELRRRVKKTLGIDVINPKLSSSTPSSSSSKLSASQRLLSLFKSKTCHSKQYKSFFDELKGRYHYLFGHLKSTFMPRKSFHALANHLEAVMQESLPSNDKYASDDDELPTEKVSQELVEEMLETVDEAKLRKVVDEMMRQRCTSGDENQYHTDKINSLNNDIFLVVIFPDDDIKERTSRWVDKCVKKFNPYAQYSIVQVIKTTSELGHEHKFATKIITRRENGSIVSITEPDNKNLNKNDIEDMYLLCINGKVDDYAKNGLVWSLSVFIRSIAIWERVHDFQLGVESYQQKVNLTAPTITFPGIEKKRCSPSVLEGLKSYKNDVKHGYVTPSLSKEDAEYLQQF